MKCCTSVDIDKGNYTVNTCRETISIRLDFFALSAERPIRDRDFSSCDDERNDDDFVSRFLDEISSKSIRLEGRIMAVVLATAAAANVSTGRMKVVVLLVPLPLFSFFPFLLEGLECQNEQAGFARGPPCR